MPIPNEDFLSILFFIKMVEMILYLFSLSDNAMNALRKPDFIWQIISPRRTVIDYFDLKNL